ncbi:hypothetical protein QCA50_011890 [Cerrena zonata]|uniref:Uncharacterized protein n=1 Tax=Cerrena zonata TaxID=2478898 RepID=A0AAW0G512_9APHY
MLSTLGFDRKSSGRADNRNPAKYVREMPRAIVHAFTSTDPSPPPILSSKVHYSRSGNQSAMSWSKPIASTRPDTDKKPSPPGTRSYQLSVYAPPFEPKNSNSKPYQIYPSNIPDTYIYERSLSSVSDLLASPASSSSSESDLNGDFGTSLLEISSTRASSSTETLETTALAVEQTSRRTSVAPQIAAASSSQRSRDSRDIVTIHSGDDSDTTQSDDDVPLGPYAMQSNAPATGIGASLPLSTPVRRSPSERGPQDSSVPQTTTRPPLYSKRTDSSTVSYDENTPREPPGLNRSTSVKQGRVDTCLVGGVVDVTSKRTVRWKEDSELASDLPIRSRKGWYNRKGDQLWTNDGRFKIPKKGQEYPPDLSNYPEANVGWMNENGVRIDMQHRLVVPPPPRPCLKRSNRYN